MRGVLGDGLGALADGVPGQLTRKQQTNGRLDLTTRDRQALAAVRQSRQLGRDALVHKAVHDALCLIYMADLAAELVT